MLFLQPCLVAIASFALQPPLRAPLVRPRLPPPVALDNLDGNAAAAAASESVGWPETVESDAADESAELLPDLFADSSPPAQGGEEGLPNLFAEGAQRGSPPDDGLPDLFGDALDFDAEEDSAPADDGVWGSGSWAGEEGSQAADWLSAAAPARRSRPIETTNVGRVCTPFKRRNGYHVEVAVQHSGRDESIHRLWFGHQVLGDVAKLHGRDEHEIDVVHFGEAVVSFLQAEGVDLSDPDWGMDDDSIPFTVEYLPLRALFDYYPHMPGALAEACLTDMASLDGADNEEPRNLTDEELDAPFVLDRPFVSLDDEPMMPSREALQAAVDAYDAARPSS